MGVIIRQSIKGTIVNYIGVGIGFITTFIVLTRFLTTEEVGLTRVLVDASTLLAGLAQLGTNASVIRFYPYFKDENKKDHGFFFWTLVVPFIGFMIYGLIFVILHVPISNVFAEKSHLFVDYYYYVLPLAFFILYSSVFETNSVVLLRIVVPRFIQEVGLRLMALVTYLLYAFRFLSIDGFVISFCSVYGIATLLMIFYLFSLKKVSLKPELKYITKSLRKDYFFYTLFLITSALGTALIPSINTFFISAKMGLAFTGVFAIASFIAAVISIPYRSLNAITQPHISQSVKNGDIAEVNKLSKNVSLHQLLIGSFIFFLIWINIDFIFQILPNGEQYATGKMVVFILGFTGLIYSTVNVGNSVLGYSPFYYYSLIFTFLITAIAIILNNVLIPIWGINGAAMASFIAQLINFSLLLSLNWWKMKTSPFSFNQLKIVVIICLLFLLNWVWIIVITPLVSKFAVTELYSCIIDSILRSTIFTIAGIISVYYWKVSGEVNDIIKRHSKKLVNKTKL
jgi:O-antigen/teichoic acid export membrane protein